jgi:lysine-N-methylase
VLVLGDARYRCTTCGDCCRGWDVPLQPGEAERFRELAAPLVPAERLKTAIGRGKHNGVIVETLAGRLGQCPALAEDQLCRIHGAHGEAAKPRACRIFPYTFVATPSGVRVGLSWACPAVVDGEGPTLDEQRGEIEALFAAAVDGTRYLLQVGGEVPLDARHRLQWPEAERLLTALRNALSGGTRLLDKLCGAGALSALTLLALDEGKPFDAALAEAGRGAPALVRDALAAPPEVDRLSRALFRTLLRTTEPGAASTLSRLGQVAQSLWGGGRVKLRGGLEVALADVENVARGLGDDGERLFVRWVEGALDGLTFFGDAAFGLSISSGLDLLVLAAAVAAFLARAYAAAGKRERVTVEDARAALRQIDAGLSHRSGMPPSFSRALEATASLDLLREQVSA